MNKENISSQILLPLRKEGKEKFYSLPSLKEKGFSDVSRIPISIRIILESLLRNFDGKNITEKHILNLSNYNAKSPSDEEIPFIVSRIILQDFTGVPLIVDLAAMRDAAKKYKINAKKIEPLVPVDLVIDHSIQVDFSRSKEALKKNIDQEFERNRERYTFLKWGEQAFEFLRIIPPAVGIVHQVNLEYLSPALFQKNDICYPDTLVGTDSHTTMINGLGVVGWGVGGIEAEAAMLGQPITFRTPEVIGVHLDGSLPLGSTATDIALKITQLLREENVVGKFVEFFGEGVSRLSLPDRATIANMAPEYGATIGFFPIDEKTTDYLRETGRGEEKIQLFETYFKKQELWGIPKKGEIDYSKIIELSFGNIVPSVSGPKRPQDHIPVKNLKSSFEKLLKIPENEGGFGITEKREKKFKHGDILIAAITSCTNTSNPGVMIAAGLLAKAANERGLQIPSYIKTSLAPGSRVVTDYLEKSGLQKELDMLGFQTVGYGCTTCIGNSGPLSPEIEKEISERNIIGVSVLSGNRNFEARIHPKIKANFLMSPPLVIAYALAGTIDINLEADPLGKDKKGNPVFLKDLWSSPEEIEQIQKESISKESYKRIYSSNLSPKQWEEIPSPKGINYKWEENSTYIQSPPFFELGKSQGNIQGAKLLGLFGDSLTTDHISPAGAISEQSSAGKYLLEKNIPSQKFNSYGSRRGNDRIMTRGTFANVRISNLLLPNIRGGKTLYFEEGKEEGEILSIYEAAQRYRQHQIPLIVIGGKDYGMGSSRDWAAKGTRLLGVKAVIATSFERIHRSNLIGMGVLPLVFQNSRDQEMLDLKGNETFHISNIENLSPNQVAKLTIESKEGEKEIPLIVRIETNTEIEYYREGGILPYILKQYQD